MKSNKHPFFPNKYCTFLFLGVYLLSPVFLFSQSYSTTAGLRFGNHLGLTVNQWVGDKLTGEAIIETNLESAGRAHVLIRKHSSILWKRVNLYAGAGPHIGWGQKSNDALEEDPAETVWGVTGVLGLELTLFHLNVSFDYLPVYQQGQENVKGYKHGGALSVRYVLEQADNKKRRKRRKNKRQRQRHKKKAQKGRDIFKL
ncbi:MAG: hypothetical protein AAF694_23710 [Bacteroidota bacterium]